MTHARVAITGVGLISPLANNVPEHFDRLCACQPVLAQPESGAFQDSLLEARVRGFDRRRFVPDRMLRKLLSPSPAYALGAATQALTDAGLAGADLTECGLYAGSVCLDANPEALIPALRESINAHDEVDISLFASHGIKLVDPLFLVKSLPNAGLCAIAIQHQALGPNANITNGTVSGMQAVIAAFQVIRRRQAEFALAGGYDSLLQMDSVVEHLLAGRLARRAEPIEKSCRPFQPGGSGYALGEGAAFLMLESFEHAQSRGARIYVEILSGGEASDPSLLFGCGRGRPEGLQVAAAQALETGGIQPEGVDAVFGDALALPEDDRREVAVYRNIFRSSAPPFTGATPVMGFSGAASGVFSLLHACLAMTRGILPPLANCEGIDACGFLPVVDQARSTALSHALAWSSDRGVKNAAMILAAYRN